MEQTINVKWSKVVWSTTILTLVLLICVSCFIIQRFLENNSSFYLTFGILLLFWVTILISFLLAPQYIELTDSKLVIPYDQIELLILYCVNMPRTVRCFGSGGFFGFLGLFYNSEFACFTAYIGDLKQLFFVKTTRGKKYMLSCEDRDTFIRQITELVGNP